MASGQEAASSCSPLALERGLSAAFIGRRLLLLLSYVTLPRGARRSFSCARFVELRRPRVEAGAWKRVLGGWD